MPGSRVGGCRILNRSGRVQNCGQLRNGGTMLILARRIGESIVIGDSVIVKVLGVRSGIVKLGIEAPKHTPVNRQEIYKRLQRELEECRRCIGAAERGDPPSRDHPPRRAPFPPEQPKDAANRPNALLRTTGGSQAH